MLNAPKAQQKILPPEGTHMARCVGLIYLGTIEGEWQGKPIYQDKIRLTFELPEELYEFKEGEGKKPFTISREFTLSLADKSNLYPIVEGIEGYIPEEVRASYDVENLVGKECLISIKHKKSAKGTTYASLESTSSLMKNQKCPKAVNPLKILTYDKWNQEYFDSLPSFIRESMMSSKQFIAKFGAQPELPDDEPEEKETSKADEIPF